MPALKSYLKAPTSYVREDGAEMIQVSPHQYISRIALATLCSSTRTPPPKKAAGQSALSILADF